MSSHQRIASWTEVRISTRKAADISASLVLIFSITIAPRALAADGQGHQYMAMFGIGNNSCAQYLQAAESERRARPSSANPDAIYSADYGSYVDFADGFLTGANSTSLAPNLLVGLDSDHPGRMAWLENYCRNNPLGYYVSALMALRTYLTEHGR